MDSEELSDYVFAKLAEGQKLSQDNIRADDTPFEHRKTYFRIGGLKCLMGVGVKF